MLNQSIPLLLSQLLSDIIEINHNNNNNIPDNNIQLGLWNGLLLLENIYLKKNLFENEKIPVSLSYGSIERIEIKIPWNNLGNEKIKIEIKNLFIICKPKYKRDTLEMKYKRELNRKRTLLNTLEILFNSKSNNNNNNNNTNSNSNSNSNSSNSGSNNTLMSFSRYFIEKIIKSMLSNFEINIKNFHFRYEDHISCDNEFCFGMTMESFSLSSSPTSQSSSSSSTSSFGTLGMISSLLSSTSTQPISLTCSIDSVSIYLNQLVPRNIPSLTTNLGSYSFIDKSPEEIYNLMLNSIPTNYSTSPSLSSSLSGGGLLLKPKHQYLVKPFHTICNIDISFGTYDSNGNSISNNIQVTNIIFYFFFFIF